MPDALGRPTWSAHLSMLFAELPPVARPAAAAAAGFTHAEAWWPGDDPTGWANAIGAAGLQLACLNADGGDLAAGERGFLNVAERREASVAAVVAAVELARSLGGRVVNVLVGRCLDGVPLARQLAEARAALLDCVPFAEAAGVTLVVEHLNELDVPGALLPTPRAAARLLEELGSPSVRLLYDAYHAARSGLDPIADVGTYRDLIEHAQYADVPGRGQPGTGTVDLRAFAAAVAAGCYEGVIGLELTPTTMSPAALATFR